MASPIPGGNEPGYLAFALVDGLLDLLVSKGTISKSDVNSMLTAIADRLRQEGTVMGKTCSLFVTNRMVGKP